MNAQDYISSGLLEGYLLGALSAGEMEQVAGAMCRFAEVRSEVAALELSLLHQSAKDAVAPPPALQDKIWAAIQASAPRVAQNAEMPAIIPAMHQPAGNKKVISLGATTSWRMTLPLAASLALLAGSLAASFIFWDRGHHAQNRLASAQSHVEQMDGQLQTMSAQQQSLVASLARYQKEADMMAQPGMQTVPLKATKKDSSMAVTVYWDKSKGEAYVSVQKMPPPPAGMQYQLWAIAAGKPVDLGMMSNETAITKGMQRIPKAVTASQAFAISLEREGGASSPTADRIYVLGKTPV